MPPLQAAINCCSERCLHTTSRVVAGLPQTLFAGAFPDRSLLGETKTAFVAVVVVIVVTFDASMEENPVVAAVNFELIYNMGCLVGQT